MPIADGRMLIALEEPVTEEAFELLVRDALEDRRSQRRRELFAELFRVLREARLETRVTRDASWSCARGRNRAGAPRARPPRR